MNIVFAGTPDFAAASLRALDQSRHKVVAVYTQPDRPAGRGRKLIASPVKHYAVEHGIDVFQPSSLKESSDIDRLSALNADVMVVVAYGLILPEAVLALPKYGCLNVHASLLPRWRGAAPIQRAIEAGDENTGITIMQMDAGLDTGPMLAKSETPITADDTGGSLHERLAELGAGTLLQTLEDLEAGRANPERQDDAIACYAKKLNKAEATADWTQPAAVLERRVRAFNPWPIVSSRWNGKRLRILRARIDANHPDDAATAPGTICAADETGLSVTTGEGVLILERLQLEGGKPLSAKDFLNGHAIQVGDCLGS